MPLTPAPALAEPVFWPTAPMPPPAVAVPLSPEPLPFWVTSSALPELFVFMLVLLVPALLTDALFPSFNGSPTPAAAGAG
jgi:hypothetical protein